MFHTCSAPPPNPRLQQTKSYYKAMTLRNLKNTSIANNGVEQQLATNKSGANT
jgi:hypothetical protein